MCSTYRDYFLRPNIPKHLEPVLRNAALVVFKLCSTKWRWRSGSTQQVGHWVLHPHFNHFTVEPQNTILLWIKVFITLKFFGVSKIFWLRNDLFLVWINKLSLLWDCTERVHSNSKRSSYYRLNYYSCHSLHILTVLSWRLTSLLCPCDLGLSHDLLWSMDREGPMYLCVLLPWSLFIMRREWPRH